MESKNVLVLGVKRYDFTNRETGEVIRGTKVHYVDLDASGDDDVHGLVPSSTNLPYDSFGKFSAVPGIYSIDLTIDLTAKRPTVKIKAFNFLSEFTLKDVM